MSTRFLSWSLMRDRRTFNLLGGSLTLLSLALPWGMVDGRYPLSVFDSGGLFPWAVPWLLAGGLFSYLSGYGAWLTFVGSLIFRVAPFYLPWPMTWSYGPGSWLVLAGAGASLLGSRWSVQSIPRGHEVVGALLYAVGFVVVATLVLASRFASGYVGPTGLGWVIVESPLIIVGFLLLGVGVKVLFGWNREERASPTIGDSTSPS